MSSRRITKSLASEIAKEMLKEKYEKLKSMRDLFVESVKSAVFDQSPKLIQDAIKKHPNYFGNYVKGIYANGYSLGYFDVTCPDGQIKSHKVGEELIKAMTEKDAYEKELKKVRKELESAIFECRTFNKLHEILPDAAKFLPDGQEFKLALNVDDLLNNIKKL